jgi:hypothetical protein
MEIEHHFSQSQLLDGDPRKPEFNSRKFYVEFVVDKVALGQISFKYFAFS